MEFTLNKDKPLTNDLLRKILELSKSDSARYDNLHNYYVGKQAITRRTMNDSTKPNNKIVHPFGNYITDTLTGYFLGEPVTYVCNDKELLQKLTLLLKANDSAAEDAELARDASIYGVAYELFYIDEAGAVRFKKVKPQEVILIYDDTVAKNVLYGIRLIKNTDLITNKITYSIEVYGADSINYYEANDTLTTLKFTGEEPNFFGAVPIIEFKNNEDRLGDFETIISLIDAYDKLDSDNLNDYEAFVDSYMVLKGVVADADDVKTMKENRVLLLDNDADARWLTKNENGEITENLKARLENDIHKFAKCPNLSDENFSSNASGIAIKFKLYGTETLVSTKEREFTRALQKRLQLILQYMALRGEAAADYLSIDIQFTRNVPTNDTEIAETVEKLAGIVSRQTLLAQLPFINDVAAEVEKLEKENEEQPFYNLESELGA